jgi:hypothetical protein
MFYFLLLETVCSILASVGTTSAGLLSSLLTVRFEHACAKSLYILAALSRLVCANEQSMKHYGRFLKILCYLPVIIIPMQQIMTCSICRKKFYRQRKESIRVKVAQECLIFVKMLHRVLIVNHYLPISPYKHSSLYLVTSEDKIMPI